MRELFQGKVCCECGKEASRLKRRKQKDDGKVVIIEIFYCFDCFGPKQEPMEFREIKLP